MRKEDARKLYKQRRQDLTPTQVLAFSLAIEKKLLPILENKQHIHVFLPINKWNEVNTFPLIDQLLAAKKSLYTSRVNLNQQLEHIQLEKDYQASLELDDWEIPTLKQASSIQDFSQIDVILMSLLISDKAGNRVGYGKGMYDGFLTQCKHNPLKIGINYFEPIEQIEDIWQGDVRLDRLVTPNKIFSH